jgi:hypothetical protein
MIQPVRGPLVSRLRQRKFQRVRRFQISEDALPGSLSLTHLCCGKPTCHCAADGTVVEAYGLTNFPSSTVGPGALFRMAKSRWEIENQGFNQAPSRHGLEQICHHHANRLRIGGLLAILALTIERLYRLRYLRRGTHPRRSSAELFLTLGVNLFRPRPVDTP